MSDEVKSAVSESLEKLELLKEALIVHLYRLKEEGELQAKVLKDDLKDYRYNGFPIPDMVLKGVTERHNKLLKRAEQMMPLIDDRINDQEKLKEFLALNVIKDNFD